MKTLWWFFFGTIFSFIVAGVIEWIKDFWIRRRKAYALIAMLNAVWSEVELGKKRVYTIIDRYYKHFLKVLMESKIDKDVEIVKAIEVTNLTNIINRIDPIDLDYGSWQKIIEIFSQDIDYISGREADFLKKGIFVGRMSTSRIYTHLWNSLCSEICSQIDDQELIKSLHKVYYHFDLINFNMESPNTRIHGIAMARDHLLGIEEDSNHFRILLYNYICKLNDKESLKQYRDRLRVRVDKFKKWVNKTKPYLRGKS